MGKKTFTIQGNICGDRVRIGRALHKPPLSQEGLAAKLRRQGLESITKHIISRIETNRRHVVDAELRALGMALNVTIDWLCEEAE